MTPALPTRLQVCRLSRTSAPRTLFLLTCVLAWGGLSGPVPVSAMTDRIVAVVNKNIITLSELQEEMADVRKELHVKLTGQEYRERLQQLEFHALSRLIERRLQIQLADEKGLNVTDEEVENAMAQYTRQGNPFNSKDPRVARTVREQLTLLKVLQREVNSGIFISELEVEHFYQTHTTRFMQPAEYHLSQILIRRHPGETPRDTTRRAQEVYDLVQHGKDFGDLAREYSDGSEGMLGGTLGVIRQGELDAPIEKALATLQSGDISTLVKTDVGFHIVLVEERTPGQLRPFEDVKDQVRRQIARSKSRALYHQWIYELQNRAHIEVKFHPSHH